MNLNSKKESPKKTEVYDWQILSWILPNLQRRANTSTPKLLDKIEREGTLLNSFYEARQGQIHKWELQANLLNERWCRNPQLKKWQTESNNISERSFTMTKLASKQGCRDGSTYANQ
jgi:hypothetical protein